MKNRNLLLILLMGLSMVLNAQTVTIGTQVWMSKNLDVATFRNGDAIPEAKTDAEWKEAGENGQPAWCYFDNDPKNGEKYGKLYNWYAVNDPRGLAPEGYHVPTDAEWTKLENLLGSDAGKKMKSATGWNNYSAPTGTKSGNGSNSSGFSGLPGGTRNNDGTFYSIGEDGDWWSSTEDESDFSGLPLEYAWFRSLRFFNGNVYSGFNYKQRGMSVRCLRD